MTATNDPKQARPRISLIVAMAKNRVIGADNALPWHLPSDLKRFKALTMGHHIVMGRKTFESIGRVLPGRTSIVITRNPAWRAEGVLVASSLDEAIRMAAGDDEIFVIGGEQVFREALALADRVHLTELERDFQGDVRFPELPAHAWKQVSVEALRDEKAGLGYSNRLLERIRR